MFGIQMDKSKIKGSDPLERVEVKSSFEASYRSNVFLFPEEAHANIIPKLGRIWIVHSSNSILE